MGSSWGNLDDIDDFNDFELDNPPVLREVSTTVVKEDDAPVAPPTRPAQSVEWPARLVLDVALGTPDIDVCEAYGLQFHELEDIKLHPAFKVELDKALAELSKEGVSFRKKAQIQADALLERSWQVMHDPNTPPTVIADLIKSTVRWAGYEQAPKDSKTAPGGGLSIRIDLGGAQPQGITIDQVSDDE